jgi:hypothetical protein
MNLVSPGDNLTVNIPNDDFGGTFSFASPTYAVVESKPSVLLTVKRTGGLANAAVTYQTVDGTAISGNDFTAVSPTALSFAAGQTKATIVIPILHDPAAEGTRSFTVPLSGPTAGGSLGTPATATVMIQDAETVVTFGAATYTVKEPLSGTAKLLIPVRRVGPMGAFTVDYSSAGSTASNFVLTPASPLSFGPTETVKTLTLTVAPNGLFEGNTTVVLTLSGPNGAGLGAIPVTTATVTDAQPVISLGAANYLVNEPKTMTPAQAVITVKRTGDLSLASTVAYTVNQGSATADSDYNPAGVTPASPITFLARQSAMQLRVPILPDAEDEPDETFTLALVPPPANASLGSLASTTVTIRDNDVAGRIQLVGTQWSVSEGVGSATLQLTRTKGTAGNASVVCQTANGTATAGSDYTATAQTVTFGPGQTSATCTIPITSDGISEGAETVLVSLTTPSFGVTIGTPNAGILYIVDDE